MGSKYLVAVVIASVILSHGQQTSLSLVDNSVPGSPVVLYGTATQDQPSASEDSYRAHVSIKNVSHNGILLMVSEINARGSNVHSDFRDIDDYFFKPEIFEHDAAKTLETTIGPLRHSTPSGSDLIFSIHAAFVQFVDGSTWGDARIGKEIMSLTQRTVALDTLKALVVTYRAKGEGAFIADLMKPSQAVEIRRLQAQYSRDQEAKVVIEKINMMLHAAELHQRRMNGIESETAARS